MAESHSVSIDINDIKISKSELAQRLKTPVGFEHEIVSECEDIIKKICVPKCCVSEVEIKTKDDDVIFSDGFKITSKDLSKNLKGCTKAYLMAVTLGIEADRKIMSLGVISPAKGFMLDAVASAYAEALADHMSGILAKENRLRPRFSPGYGDLSLEVQKFLLGVLNADKLTGIKLGENLLMTPRKSVTAIQGVECDA